MYSPDETTTWREQMADWNLRYWFRPRALVTDAPQALRAFCPRRPCVGDPVVCRSLGLRISLAVAVPRFEGTTR